MSEQPESGSRLGDYLSHMLEAICLARAYTEGMDIKVVTPFVSRELAG